MFQFFNPGAISREYINTCLSSVQSKGGEHARVPLAFSKVQSLQSNVDTRHSADNFITANEKAGNHSRDLKSQMISIRRNR